MVVKLLDVVIQLILAVIQIVILVIALLMVILMLFLYHIACNSYLLKELILIYTKKSSYFLDFFKKNIF
ncbi:hypothetical protein KAOT1_03227 [Kordia algicida OT-1]|uniref:Uncharacterized protein n=1 Tax=Kordia algicida OT-1 TaxID=391587 RepID=A9DV86_9FLAO|nr:hypothetical protein KAOT1_03227 [Kordia algicida OT-1]